MANLGRSGPRECESVSKIPSSLRKQGPITTGISKLRRVGKGALRAVPTIISCKQKNGGLASLSPPYKFPASLRRGLIGLRIAAGQESQRDAADRQNRDQFLDADGADHLDAGGDQ